MKFKLLTAVAIFIIMFLCAISCNMVNANRNYISEKGSDKITWTNIYEFTYKKHSYIGFFRYKGWGVVHDPECKCFKK